MDPSPKRQSWKISVHAMSKGMDLKLSASNVLPHWGRGGERISLLLRLRRFFLEVKSKNRDPARREPPRSRLFRFFNKILRRRRWKCLRKNFATEKRSERRNSRVGFPHSSGGHFPGQAPMAAMMGSLSFLSHSASEKNHEGITIHALTFFFYLVLLFKMRTTQLPLLLVTLTVSLIGFTLSYLTCTDLVPKAVWKAWNNTVSLGCFSALSQVTSGSSLPSHLSVLFSRISLPNMRNLMMSLIILAWLAFVLHEWSSEILFKFMKTAIEGAPVLIPNLLLTCQTFYHILGELEDPAVLGLYLSSAHFWGKKLIKTLVSYAATRSN